MPKRARCPHCDCLFNRDQLDIHIRKCRSKKTRPQKQHSTQGRKNLVLDGNNIAFYLSPNDTPLVGNLMRAHQSLVSVGYRLIIVVSAALKHKIDKPDTLHDLITEGLVLQATRGTNDDLMIIQESQKRNADIVSNDRFLNWIDRFPWVPDRLRKYRLTPAGLILI